MISAYTQSPSVASESGIRLTLYDGSIICEFSNRKKNELIVMNWRMRDWQPDDWSTVEIMLTAPNATTCKLVLKQTKIPHADKFGNRDLDTATANGWKNMIFKKIQLICGYQKVDVDEDED